MYDRPTPNVFLQYQYKIWKWWEKTQMSIRGLLVDPISYYPN